jgi:hypothetical protein
MRADNTTHLISSARNRHEITRAKALRTLRELDTAGHPITFEALARAAGVSRSWLYTQPDIRTEIERLRDLDRRPLPRPASTDQRGSNASLAQRLDISLTRNRELSAENQRLRRQLSVAIGRLRAAGIATEDEPAPPRRGSITIGPC